MSRSNRRFDGSGSIEGTSGRSADRKADSFGFEVEGTENGGEGGPQTGKADSFGSAPPPPIERCACAGMGAVNPIRLRTLRTAVSVTPMHAAI